MKRTWGWRFLTVASLLGIVLLLSGGHRAEEVSLALREATILEENLCFNAAAARLEDFVLSAPGRSEGYIHLGRVRLKQGAYSLAAEAFAQAYEHGGGATALAMWGDALFAQGRTEQALAKWADAASEAGDTPTLSYRRGLASMKAGDFTGAITEMHRALADPRLAPLAHCALGALLTPDDPDAALGHLRACANPEATVGWWSVLSQADASELASALENPDPYARLMGVGGFFVRRELFGLAERAFAQAVELHPEDPTAWAYLGYARSRLGMDPSPEFERALHIRYPDPLTHYLWGLHLKSRGKLEAAAQEFAYAHEHNPQNPAYCAALAEIHLLEGDYRAAEGWFREAVELAPDEPGFRLLLARFYVDTLIRGDEEAREAAEKALSLAPEDPAAWELAGLAYYYAGQGSRALQYLRKGLQLAPENPCEPVGRELPLSPVGPCPSEARLRILYRLGSVYARLGQREAARDVLCALNEAAPESPWAEKARWLLIRLGFDVSWDTQCHELKR